MKKTAGGVVAARGYAASGIPAGLKRAAGALDLGMIVSEAPAVAAGVFTTNRVKGAAVLLDRSRIVRGRVRGIVINSGNANACTGVEGRRNAARMAALAAECVGARPGEFLVASTGIIGRQLPMTKVEAGIRAAAAALGRSGRHAAAITRAIMTTDIRPKSCAVAVMIGGRPVRIGGIAKGSGMIAPSMATMLSFITTDCAISRTLLQKALNAVAAKTYNCITIDGDMSTNDTVLLLANGAAGNAPIRADGAVFRMFCSGLLRVAEELCRALVLDGEGATRFVEVQAVGGRDDAEARRVARSIANSPLVKTAVHGGDPNWGRIICAAGYSGAPVEPARMRLWINGLMLFRAGMPCPTPERRLAACMKPREIIICLDLGRGRGKARVWTCDLSKEYVTINADYHT